MKPIPNQEGYFADREGNIYSNKAKGGNLRKLKPRKRKKGDNHLSIMLTDRKEYFVHRLVYETFNGSIPEGLLICHKNDEPSDNSLKNLYAGTHKENHADAKRNGKKPIGEKSTSSKLKEKDVLRIWSLRNKVQNADLAKEYKVSRSTICDIIKGRTWNHIERSVEND